MHFKLGSKDRQQTHTRSLREDNLIDADQLEELSDTLNKLAQSKSILDRFKLTRALHRNFPTLDIILLSHFAGEQSTSGLSLLEHLRQSLIKIYNNKEIGLFNSVLKPTTLGPIYNRSTQRLLLESLSQICDTHINYGYKFRSHSNRWEVCNEPKNFTVISLNFLLQDFNYYPGEVIKDYLEEILERRQLAFLKSNPCPEELTIKSSADIKMALDALELGISRIAELEKKLSGKQLTADELAAVTRQFHTTLRSKVWDVVHFYSVEVELHDNEQEKNRVRDALKDLIRYLDSTPAFEWETNIQYRGIHTTLLDHFDRSVSHRESFNLYGNHDVPTVREWKLLIENPNILTDPQLASEKGFDFYGLLLSGSYCQDQGSILRYSCRSILDFLLKVRPLLFSFTDAIIKLHQATPFTSLISDDFSARTLTLYVRKVLNLAGIGIQDTFFLRAPPRDHSAFYNAISQLDENGYRGYVIGSRPLIISESIVSGKCLAQLVKALKHSDSNKQVTVVALGDDDFDIELRNLATVISGKGPRASEIGDMMFTFYPSSFHVRRSVLFSEEESGPERNKKVFVPGFYDESPGDPPRKYNYFNSQWYLEALLSLAEYYVFHERKE